MDTERVVAVILAAGQGTRMKSIRPKVLHEVAGRPMVDYVVEAALEAGAASVWVVVGREREQVERHLGEAFGERVATVVQEPQRGTGDAVRCALPALGSEAEVALVLYGDTPLVRSAELRELLEARAADDAPLAILTCTIDDPTGYGRVVRDPNGAMVAVREHRDATTEELALREVNAGMYAARLDVLRAAIDELRPDNDQGELYLTDVVAAAARRGRVVHVPGEPSALEGVNDRAQLARVEEALHERIADRWRRAGATVRAGALIDSLVTLEPDCTVDCHALLRGRTHVGRGASVGAGALLVDVTLAEDAMVKAYSVCIDATIGPRAQVGPFAHLRAATTLAEDARIGNFVETKKTRLAAGAKANHLAYLGDGEIGAKANVGAGTIFCNYDGFHKHRTTIEAGAFIGSDSQLVAPVTVGAGAYVATGTTVTRDVPPDALAIARIRQENKEGYASRLRGKLAARAKKKDG